MHVPTLPGWLHDWQVPAQSERQQTSSKQKPLLQSAAPSHAAPISAPGATDPPVPATPPLVPAGAARPAVSARARHPGRRVRRRRGVRLARLARAAATGGQQRQQREQTARAHGGPEMGVRSDTGRATFSPKIGRFPPAYFWRSSSSGTSAKPQARQLTRPDTEVVGRDAHELRGDVRRELLSSRELVDDRVDADLAPQVRRLGEQHGREPGLDIGELRRQRVDGNDFHRLAPPPAAPLLQLMEQRLRVQRPAPDHRPALDVRVRGVDVDHRRARLLRRLDGVEGAHDLEVGVARGLAQHPLDAAGEVGRGAVARQHRDVRAPRDQPRQLRHDRLARLDVVDAAVGEPPRLRRVAVEGHHRHAAGDRVVDRRRHDALVRHRQQHRVHPFLHRLRDPLRLHAAVLLRRRQPFDLDRAAPATPTARGRGSRRRCGRRRTTGCWRSSRSSRCAAVGPWRRARRGELAGVPAPGIVAVAAARGGARRDQTQPPPRRRPTTAPCSFATAALECIEHT